MRFIFPSLLPVAQEQAGQVPVCWLPEHISEKAKAFGSAPCPISQQKEASIQVALFDTTMTQ